MSSRRAVAPWREYLPVTAVVAFGTLIAISAFLLLRAYSYSKEQEQFQRNASYYSASVRGEIDRHLNSLSAIRAFVTASHVTRWEFSAYARQIMPQNPALQKVLWVPIIDRGQRVAFETALQEDGLYGLKIHSPDPSGNSIPDPARDRYFPITFAEPADTNLHLIGVDLGGVASFTRLFREADQTQHVAAVIASALAPTLGIADGKILLAYPLVDQNAKPLGYALGIMQTKALVANAMALAPPSLQADLFGIDGQLDAGRADLAKWFSDASFHKLVPVAIGNQKLQLAFRSTGRVDPLRSLYLPAGSALLVIALTGLLVQSMSSTLLQKRAVERAVLTRTAELTAANQNLSMEIEQRRRAEDNLSVARDRAEAASQAKSAFLATMSHELRTPLNSVIGFSNVLASDRRLLIDHRPFVDEILTNGYRLLRLINDILDLTQMLSLEAKTCSDLVYMTDIIPVATESIAALAARSGITIQTAMPDDLPAIHGDCRRLQRAVIHLVENAVKFNNIGGAVYIRISEEADSLNLVIEDTGIGMPEQQRARAGESFSKDEHVLNRRHEGSGLGLSYVARVAELHGTPVNISERVGGGTVICLAFHKIAAEKAVKVA